jgi:hypothetical protein
MTTSNHARRRGCPTAGAPSVGRRAVGGHGARRFAAASAVAAVLAVAVLAAFAALAGVTAAAARAQDAAGQASGGASAVRPARPAAAGATAAGPRPPGRGTAPRSPMPQPAAPASAAPASAAAPVPPSGHGAEGAEAGGVLPAAGTDAEDRSGPDGALPLRDRAGPPLATDADAAVPPAGVGRGGRRRPAADDDRERWRLPPDLVNPFLDEYGSRFDADERRWSDAESEGWYVVDEELVDPWLGTRRYAPFGALRCRGSRCIALREAPALLAAPRLGLRRAGRPEPGRRVELGAFVGVATVGDDGRPRLEVQATVRRGALGVAFSVLTSVGDTLGTVGPSMALREAGHARHAVTVALEHRFADARVALDLGLHAGVLLAELGDDAEVLPLVRTTLTGAVRLGEAVDFVVRADGGTTFVRPGDFLLGGPSAFEAALSLGLRVGAR